MWIVDRYTHIHRYIDRGYPPYINKKEETKRYIYIYTIYYIHYILSIFLIFINDLGIKKFLVTTTL